jgi:hypothetical protein
MVWALIESREGLQIPGLRSHNGPTGSSTSNAYSVHRRKRTFVRFHPRVELQFVRELDHDPLLC